MSRLQNAATLSDLAVVNSEANAENPNISMTWNITITRICSLRHPSGIVSGMLLPKKFPFFSQSIMMGTIEIRE
jgi:hypothetical protein